MGMRKRHWHFLEVKGDTDPPPLYQSPFPKERIAIYNNINMLETFMGVDQRAGPGTNPCISLVVSKSESNHVTATKAHRTLGLMPAGTICRSDLSLSYYPISSWHPSHNTYTLFAFILQDFSVE